MATPILLASVKVYTHLGTGSFVVPFNFHRDVCAGCIYAQFLPIRRTFTLALRVDDELGVGRLAA